MPSKKTRTRKSPTTSNSPPKPVYIEWAFTTREGGMWHQLPLPTDAEFVKAMEEYVSMPRNHKRYLQHPEGSYNRNYTIIPIPRGKTTMSLNIFNLRFPDGRIWDSELRKFRQT